MWFKGLNMKSQTHERYLVHGVEVLVESENPVLFNRLDEDYGSFKARTGGSARAQLIVRIANHADEEISGAASEAAVVSDIGDVVRLVGGRLSISGPGVFTKKGYERSVRAYLTTTLAGIMSSQLKQNRYHASAVAFDGQGVMFFGQSGAGKTSTCVKCVIEGAAYLSHEFLFIDDSSSPIRLRGMPQAVTLGVAAVDWFKVAARANSSNGPDNMYGQDGSEKLRLPITSIAPNAQVALDAPLRAAVFLQSNFSLSVPRWCRMKRDVAAALLLQAVEPPFKWQYAPVPDFAVYFKEIFATISRLVEEVPVFHLQWCRDHDVNYRYLREMLASDVRGDLERI
jgi:hypothetical protein